MCSSLCRLDTICVEVLQRYAKFTVLQYLIERSLFFGRTSCKTPCNIREMSSYTVLTYLVVLVSDTFDYFKFS